MRVSYWAGLRVEGGLSPFGINADELTKWNDKINNGGLFEKIGNGLKIWLTDWLIVDSY